MAVAAARAASWLLMRAADFIHILMAADIFNDLNNLLLKFSGEGYAKSAVAVAQQPISRPAPKGAFHQKAVGAQLQAVAVVRGRRRPHAFYLYRNQLAFLFHQVVRFSGEPKRTVIQRLFSSAPKAGVGVNDLPLRHPRPAADDEG